MVKTIVFRGLLLLLALTLTTAGSTRGDDGWRRTAAGWERTATWRGANGPAAPHQKVATSDPIHPGQLAIWQVTLSALVLAAFMAKSNQALPGRASYQLP